MELHVIDFLDFFQAVWTFVFSTLPGETIQFD